MRIILAIIILGLLAGCAVLDVASLEKAIPLEPKKVEVCLVRSVGVDIDSAVLSPDELESGDSPADHKPQTSPVTGFQVAVGLKNEMEIGSRFWVGSDNFGVKAFYKKLLNKSGKNYLAIEPALSYLATIEEESSDKDHKYTAMGGELQLIYIHEASRYFAFTVVGRGNVNRYHEKHWDDAGSMYTYGPYLVAHGGLRGNVELRLHPFFLIPEVGLEIVPVVHGKTNVLPIYGLALGAEF